MKIMNEIKWEEKSVVLKTHVFWEATPLRLFLQASDTIRQEEVSMHGVLESS